MSTSWKCDSGRAFGTPPTSLISKPVLEGGALAEAQRATFVSTAREASSQDHSLHLPGGVQHLLPLSAGPAQLRRAAVHGFRHAAHGVRVLLALLLQAAVLQPLVEGPRVHQLFVDFCLCNRDIESACDCARRFPFRHSRGSNTPDGRGGTSCPCALSPWAGTAHKNPAGVFAVFIYAHSLQSTGCATGGGWDRSLSCCPEWGDTPAARPIWRLEWGDSPARPGGWRRQHVTESEMRRQCVRSDFILNLRGARTYNLWGSKVLANRACAGFEATRASRKRFVGLRASRKWPASC